MLLSSVFRTASKKHHPDHGGDEGRFKVLAVARDIVSGGHR